MASQPSLLRALEHASLKQTLEAHARFLSGRPGGRRANLAHADLSNVMLEGINLSEAELTGARLNGACLMGGDLSRAVLFGADLRDADLRTANLSKADLRGVCLRGANLAYANLIGADLREGRIALQDSIQGFRILTHERQPGDLDYAIMAGANLDGVHAPGETRTADLTDAILSGAQLGGARMVKATLDGADLTGAEVFNTDLSGASLRRAVLTGVDTSAANFEKADLTDVLRAPPPVVYIDDTPLGEVLAEHERFCTSGGAGGAPARISRVDFRGLRQLRCRMMTGIHAPGSVFFGMDMERVELQGSDLSGADLRGANLRGADLRGVKFVDARLDRADLRGA
ncbi:MAG TPA: pentapeptide repeat-containing protein, partial [Caulobacter sp.]|nr:pentapeptide repeat-containing protein [Caulobacter sp.]